MRHTRGNVKLVTNAVTAVLRNIAQTVGVGDGVASATGGLEGAAVGVASAFWSLSATSINAVTSPSDGSSFRAASRLATARAYWPSRSAATPLARCSAASARTPSSAATAGARRARYSA